MPKKRTGPRPYRPHGTTAAYRRHYRLGEKPCEPCRLAHNRAERQRRSKTRKVHYRDPLFGKLLCPAHSYIRPLLESTDQQAITCTACKRVLAGTNWGGGPPAP